MAAEVPTRESLAAISKVAGPVGRFFRDLMMPLALRLSANSNPHAWLYGYHLDWNQLADASGAGG